MGCVEDFHLSHSHYWLAIQRNISVIRAMYLIKTDPFDLCYIQLCQNQTLIRALRLSLISCNYYHGQSCASLQER